MSRVRFTRDDKYGAWKEGDVAEDLGWESILPEDHPDFVPVRLLKMPSGEVLSLTDPHKRGLVDVIV